MFPVLLRSANEIRVCPRWTLRGGVVGGVQTRVGQTLTKVVDLRQDRSPSRADAAEVRPCLPDQVTPTALHERCGSHQERCPNVLSVHHEVGRKVKVLRRRCRSLRE